MFLHDALPCGSRETSETVCLRLLEEDLNVFIYDLPKTFHADVHEQVGCEMAKCDLYDCVALFGTTVLQVNGPKLNDRMQ